IGLFGFQVWRVSLDRPIKGPVTLEWIIEPISLPEESTVLAPLPLPVGAEVSEVIGTVRMDPGSSWRIDTEGTIELPPQANEEVWLERVVRLGPPQRLRFVRQEPTNRSARVAQASLTTTLERFGAVVYNARFLVGGWSGRDLPIQLPPGAEIASIRLGQRPWHTHGHISTDRNFLVLPWNPARDWETVEIEYRLPGRSPIGFAWLQADPPRLPIDADWTYFWRWPDRFAPLTPGATFGTEETVTNRFEQITDWTASDSRCTTVWLVDTTAVRLVMLAEFSALIILMLVLPRGHRFLFGVGLFSLGILMIWLPAELLGGMWIPLGAGIALAMVFVVATLNRRQRRRAAANRSSFARVSATAAVGALWVGWLAGSTPQPVAVFLLPAAPGEEQAVLAPPQLLSELKSLVERAMVMTPLVLDARLEGQASAREVRWTGRFTVHAASETGGVLPLRLGDTQLISAELNGVPVFPELSVDRGTYEFRLPAQGTHRLTVVFTSLVTDGADSETRFSIAEIPICTAVVDFPQGTTEMQFLSSRGIQKIDVGGKAARLEADLGRVSTIQLRWRSATHPSDRPGTVEAAHLWDVSEQQARLLSVFRFRLGSGVMRRVEFDVPSSLELVDVVIRPVDDPLNLFGLTGPRDWRQSASPEATRHRLEFAVPLSGQVQVELELVPRQSLPENWIVTAPEVVGDYDRQTVVGVRLTGRSIQVRASMGWESASPAEFLRRHWRPLRVDALDREPEVAFRRSGPFDPTIAMALTTTPKGAVQQRVEWRTGPGRSSLQAVSQWTGIVGPGPLEWEVPAGITIHEVRGDGVAGWSRAGSVLQIWLSPQRPDAVNVTLDGFLPTPSVGTQPFELPPLRPMNVRSVHAELVVAPRDDWRMSVLDAGAYRQHPTTELPGVRWSGFAEHPSTTVWALHPAGGTIAGDVVTVVEPLDREFAFRAVARAELGLLPGSDVATVWLEAR
ncbi:MAG: hypothetical protein N2039_12955, partial [Gemmataceae bacterium]|nr:hypothetical protein [Gemmataceae bacterium]